ASITPRARTRIVSPYCAAPPHTCSRRGSTSSQPFAHVFASGQAVGVVVEPTGELPALLVVGVETGVGGDDVVGIDRWMVYGRFAGHDPVDDRLEALRLVPLVPLLAFDELGHHLAREQLDVLHDVLVAVVASRARQDDLVDAANLV